mmetsp:Transcript_21018/g.50776  ORF Transcript_21018/g.50776 Transcript_21018/m.50776 type:complete len:209 (-) Transcript_21018:279-905(-)
MNLSMGTILPMGSTISRSMAVRMRSCSIRSSPGMCITSTPERGLMDSSRRGLSSMDIQTTRTNGNWLSMCTLTLSHVSTLMFSILTGMLIPPAHTMLSSTPASLSDTKRTLPVTLSSSSERIWFSLMSMIQGDESRRTILVATRFLMSPLAAGKSLSLLIPSSISSTTSLRSHSATSRGYLLHTSCTAALTHSADSSRPFILFLAVFS